MGEQLVVETFPVLSLADVLAERRELDVALHDVHSLLPMLLKQQPVALVTTREHTLRLSARHKL